ncbi:pyridoxamine 5'-phosphate oxidase family protein [Actinomycetospora cinnamomea]|uniref:Pyridoxamine 5'-phosphate oxidase-like protein n=1 Tax=Actinomycetospora cinnamomea TaxID=663609 RepID=A0A2U1F296_9PSEU|nr:pyridoxamine 5'-phosphate oxidase family protein [Actinomycetospora cinnamomea]PVZ06305.1 pyridoxamine 5'-phosphate oxidase-like protein [Actinomycetospora cinnamomea]
MSAVEHAVVDQLGTAEARALLMTAEFGRLAFIDGHGPTVEPFAFALEDTAEDTAIVIAVGTGSGARAAVGQTVAFEVDEIDPVRRTGWSVVAVGTLHGAPATVTARPEPWPDPDGELVLLRLPAERLTGRRLRRETRRAGRR